MQLYTPAYRGHVKEGLLHEPFEGWGGFPLGDRDVPKQPEAFAESWVASEADGLVGGFVFGECEERDDCTLQFDLGELAPQSCLDLEPIYLVAGRGDWEVVRQVWRWLRQPGGVRETRKPIPHPVLTAGFEPGPLLVAGRETTATVAVHNRRGKALSGELQIADCGLEIAPSQMPLQEVKRENPARQEVTVVANDLTPRVEMARLAVTDEVTTHAFPAPAVVLGDARQPVRLTEMQNAECRMQNAGAGGATEYVAGATRVENGHLAFTVAPGFLGSVAALERAGVSYLRSGYPEPGQHNWMNPWFGGIHPFLNWPGELRFLKERFTGEPVERRGARGLEWQGVRVAADLEHKEHRWLRMEVDYLTTGGSNVLAMALRLANRTDAPQGGSFGLQLWLAVGGEILGNVLHYDQERPLYEQAGSTREAERVPRHRRRSEYGIDARCGRWAAVENAAAGGVLALVATHPDAGISAFDEAKEGVSLEARWNAGLEPGETREVIWWVALCDTVEEARAYRALGEICELP